MIAHNPSVELLVVVADVASDECAKTCATSGELLHHFHVVSACTQVAVGIWPSSLELNNYSGGLNIISHDR